MRASFWMFSLLLLGSTAVQARGFNDYEWGHELSIGGGISSPAATTSLVENPAGLVYNHDFKFLAQGAAENTSFNPLGAGGLLFLGNGTVGAGLGVQTFSSSATGAPGAAGLLDFGIAAEAMSWNLAFGVNGRYTLWNTGVPFGTGLGATWGMDVGMLYNSRGDVRVGLTVFDVLSGVDAVGLGVAADISPWATLSVDSAKDPRGSAWSLMPALGIHLSSFQITYSYGFAIMTGGNLHLRQGSSLGLGINIGPNFHIELYYNHLATYYAGLMFRI